MVRLRRMGRAKEVAFNRVADIDRFMILEALGEVVRRPSVPHEVSNHPVAQVYAKAKGGLWCKEEACKEEASTEVQDGYAVIFLCA